MWLGEEAFYCRFTVVRGNFAGQMEGQSWATAASVVPPLWAGREPTQTQREHANSTNPTQKRLLQPGMEPTTFG